MACTPNGDEGNPEERLIAAVRRLLLKARAESLSGQGTVTIDFHQGGVTRKRLGLNWEDK